MNIELFQLCSAKCIKQLKKESNLQQRNCFSRCSIKFMQALKFTSDHINFQSYQIKKGDQQHKRMEQLNSNQSILDRLKAIYDQHQMKSTTST